MTAILGSLIAAPLLFPLAAHAGGGALVQRPGADGCIRDDGGEGCRDATMLVGSFGIALSPDGDHAYVALADGRGVAALKREHATGALTQLPSPGACTSQTGSNGLCATGRGIHVPLTLAVSPDGRHVYVVSQQRDPVTLSSIALFSRDPASGILTQLPGTQGCLSEVLAECTPAIGIRNVRSIAISRDGRHVYVASITDAVAVFARDPVSGLLTQLPEPLGCISQSGNGGHCTQGKGLDGATAVAVTRDGRFVYVASEISRAVAAFARNRATGALTQLPGASACIAQDDADEGCTEGVGLASPVALALSPNDRSIYVVSPVSNELAVIARDRKTGALQSVECEKDDGSIMCETSVALRHPFSVAVSPDNRQVYVGSRDSNAVAAFARDRKTGAVTQLPGLDACISDDGSEGQCSDGRALDDPRALTFGKSGRQLYVATQGSAGVAILQRR